MYVAQNIKKAYDKFTSLFVYCIFSLSCMSVHKSLYVCVHIVCVYGCAFVYVPVCVHLLYLSQFVFVCVYRYSFSILYVSLYPRVPLTVATHYMLHFLYFCPVFHAALCRIK